MNLQNLSDVLQEISLGNNLGEEITLVGATKTVPVETINLAIQNGLKVVAENKVQEFNQKHEFILGARQHFIGHLQTNKVKYLVGKVELIHSVDTVKLANEISNCAVKRNVVQNILLEVNVGGELSKSGFSIENLEDCIKEITTFSGVKVVGLMAMLPKTDDLALKEKLCLQMREIFDKLKAQGLPFEYLSMGMSNDYKTAIKCGSNMIRLGSYIFGQRNYGDTQNGII